MMTLEEVWESLRQDPEIKATMEEAEKSYKLFKKIENLIVADLEAKLKESEKLKDDAMYNLAWLNQDLSDTKEQLKVEKDAFKILSNNYNTLSSAYDQLKQQLAEKEKEVEELKKGVYKVTLGTTPSNQIDFTENFYVIQNQTAIEKLESVKKLLKGFAMLQKTNSLVYFCQEYVEETYEIIDYIDQQIKELKGEK